MLLRFAALLLAPAVLLPSAAARTGAGRELLPDLVIRGRRLHAGQRVAQPEVLRERPAAVHARFDRRHLDRLGRHLTRRVSGQDLDVITLADEVYCLVTRADPENRPRRVERAEQRPRHPDRAPRPHA